MNRRPLLEDSDSIEMVWFKERWGREPKVWGIKDLYPLWLKTKERDKLHWNQRKEVINEIIEKITPSPFIHNGGGVEYIVYHLNRHGSDDRLYKTHIKWESEWESYSTCNSGYVGESDNIVERRNDIIDSMVDGDLRLELGTKLNNSDRLTNSWLSAIVFKSMWSIIERKLRKDKVKDPVFTISLCGDEFHIVTNLDNHHYPKYDLVHISTRETIKF